MEHQPTGPSRAEPRFEVIEDDLEMELATNSPQTQLPDKAQASKPSADPIPTIEQPDPPLVPSKKKGTASTRKTGPKKKLSGPGQRTSKKPKPDTTTSAAPTDMDEGEDEDEDADDADIIDDGPYCLCRGPDDHTWMIGCENCGDWFHGRCIHLSEEIGENLVEKFICPRCTRGDELRTIYKKVCAHGNCRKAARLGHEPPSVFCSEEHAHAWWDKMIGKMQKSRTKAGLNDQLTQSEMMAMMAGGMTSSTSEGGWKLFKAPFDAASTKLREEDGDLLASILSQEEKEFLDAATSERRQIAEETQLCQQMMTVIELAQQRRRAAITAGRFANDSCGYDSRLDTVSAREAFAQFVQTPEGQDIVQQSAIGDPVGEGDETRGMCDRKRCKAHRDWQKILPLGVKHRLREMEYRAAEVAEEERIVREAAEERWKRRRAEKNWVEAVT